MEGQGSINGRWSAALVAGLAAAGVTHVVISPGSRSTPLSLACLRSPGLVCRVLLDERVAAFYALGLARATGRPVALICTSGSAVANWHPAVVEADMSRVPLILLSSDRPPELQDCGANQTLAQTGLFGTGLRAMIALPPAESQAGWLANAAARAVSQSLWPLPGPVQINVPFREPLLAPDAASDLPQAAGRVAPRVILPRQEAPADMVEDLARQFAGRTGVIVAGAEPLPAVPIVTLAGRLGWPVLADPLSGLRFGGHDLSPVLARSDIFLRGTLPSPDWVLRFGAFPVSKPMALWLAATGARQVVVSGDSRWPDPQRSSDMMVHADPAAFADSLTRMAGEASPASWLRRFRLAEDAAGRLADEALVPEGRVVRQVIDALPDDSLLFIGNSMPVRDLDDFSGTGPQRLTILCNRGVSGIDGNLSSFFGAAASGRFTAAVALVGDLTFLHDLGGLAAGRGLNATVCVTDNGGGAIFGHLPQAVLPEFEAGWLTPQNADLGAAAAVWGHRYGKVAPSGVGPALTEALAAPGVSVLHISVDREESLAAHRALAARAAVIGTRD